MRRASQDAHPTAHDGHCGTGPRTGSSPDASSRRMGDRLPAGPAGGSRAISRGADPVGPRAERFYSLRWLNACAVPACAAGAGCGREVRRRRLDAGPAVFSAASGRARAAAMTGAITVVVAVDRQTGTAGHAVVRRCTTPGRRLRRDRAWRARGGCTRAGLGRLVAAPGAQRSRACTGLGLGRSRHATMPTHGLEPACGLFRGVEAFNRGLSGARPEIAPGGPWPCPPTALRVERPEDAGRATGPRQQASPPRGAAGAGRSRQGRAQAGRSVRPIRRTPSPFREPPA